MAETPSIADMSPDALKATFREARDVQAKQIVTNSSQAIQNAILIHLTIYPGTRPLEFSELLGVTIHRVANALKHLSVARMVATLEDPNNRRHRNYFTTRAGNEEVCRLLKDRVALQPLDLPHLVLGQLRCRQPALVAQREQRTH
jgi:DNA-binding MarR family transcriptional regulator